MKEYPTRKKIRLCEYDYGTAGAYHVTICAKKQAPVLCACVGCADLCAPSIELTSLGRVVAEYIEQIHENYPSVFVDKYVIMPNHIHLLLRIEEHGAQGSAHPTVSAVIRALKVMVRKRIGISPFQRSFHDHIIRGDDDYQETWQYIENNPLKWMLMRGNNL